MFVLVQEIQELSLLDHAALYLVEVIYVHMASNARHVNAKEQLISDRWV